MTALGPGLPQPHRLRNPSSAGGHPGLATRCQRKRVNSNVQVKAGLSQSQIIERYIHAAQVLFPGAAVKGEARMFALTKQPTGEPESLAS